MRILHISDLHIDALYRKENFIRADYLLSNICETDFDHLVITGDITENADKPSIELARKLLKKYKLLNSERATIIIGNHDIYGGVLLAEDVLNFPSKCRNTDYASKVSEFNQAFAETFASTKSVEQGSYPFIKIFDEVVLLGLNTIDRYSFLKNPFASNGRISDADFDSVRKLLGAEGIKDKKIIVLSHHHFSKGLIHPSNTESTSWQRIERQTMKLRGKKSIIRLLREFDSKLVLHGHLHENAEYERKGLTFLNSGGSVMGEDKSKLAYNLIETERTGIKTVIRTLSYEESRKESQITSVSFAASSFIPKNRNNFKRHTGRKNLSESFSMN